MQLRYFVMLTAAVSFVGHACRAGDPVSGKDLTDMIMKCAEPLKDSFDAQLMVEETIGFPLTRDQILKSLQPVYVGNRVVDIATAQAEDMAREENATAIWRAQAGAQLQWQWITRLQNKTVVSTKKLVTGKEGIEDYDCKFISVTDEKGQVDSTLVDYGAKLVMKYGTLQKFSYPDLSDTGGWPAAPRILVSGLLKRIFNLNQAEYSKSFSDGSLRDRVLSIQSKFPVTFRVEQNSDGPEKSQTISMSFATVSRPVFELRTESGNSLKIQSFVAYNIMMGGEIAFSRQYNGWDGTGNAMLVDEQHFGSHGVPTRRWRMWIDSFKAPALPLDRGILPPGFQVRFADGPIPGEK